MLLLSQLLHFSTLLCSVCLNLYRQIDNNNVTHFLLCVNVGVIVKADYVLHPLLFMLHQTQNMFISVNACSSMAPGNMYWVCANICTYRAAIPLGVKKQRACSVEIMNRKLHFDKSTYVRREREMKTFYRQIFSLYTIFM